MMNSTRMKKIYYNVEIINDTTQPINASYQVGLLTAIIKEPLKYNINVNRFRLPLNSVPLSRKNLPFQEWNVGIGYSVNQDNNFSNVIETVRQIDETILQLSTYLFLDNTANGFNLATENNFNNDYKETFTSSVGIKDYDTVGNGTVYVLNTSTSKLSMYDMVSQNLITTLTLTQTNIQSFIVNKTTGDFFVNNSIGTFKYERNGNNWIPSAIQFSNASLTSPLSYFLFLLDGFLVGYCNVGIQGGLPAYCLIMWKLVDGTIASYVPYSKDTLHSYKIISDGTSYFYVSSSVDNYQTLTKNYLQLDDSNYITVTIATYNIDTTNTPYNICGFDQSGNLMISMNDIIDVYDTNPPPFSSISTPLYSFNDPISSLQASSTVIAPSSATIPKPIDNPNYSIMSYQEYLDQINSALNTVWTKLKSIYQAIDQTIPSPIIVYNPTNQLFSLICDGAFLDNTKFRIYLNSNLWSMFLFPTYSNSNAPSDNYGLMKTISIKNNVYNATFSSSSTIPEYISVYQEASTRFKFYDLVRIIVTTTKIPVDGDIEGQNSELNAITDVIPDIDNLTPDDILIYQPTILRNYNLDSNVPLKDLDVHFYYGCKDGTTHRVKLLPSEYASIKLQFEQIIE